MKPTVGGFFSEFNFDRKVFGPRRRRWETEAESETSFVATVNVFKCKKIKPFLLHSFDVCKKFTPMLCSVAFSVTLSISHSVSPCLWLPFVPPGKQISDANAEAVKWMHTAKQNRKLTIMSMAFSSTRASSTASTMLPIATEKSQNNAQMCRDVASRLNRYETHTDGGRDRKQFFKGNVKEYTEEEKKRGGIFNAHCAHHTQIIFHIFSLSLVALAFAFAAPVAANVFLDLIILMRLLQTRSI